MKKAFTMLELVFIIVIVGILSTFISPNFQRDSLTEAANQIISHIRYTQHLAMMDNKFDASDKWWYRKRWGIYFNKDVDGVFGYMIYNETDAPSWQVAANEIAVNPLNTNQLLTGLKKGRTGLGHGGIDIDVAAEQVTKSMLLEKKFGVTDVTIYGSCGGNRIMFDHIGRPLVLSGTTSITDKTLGLVKDVASKCNIKLTKGSEEKILVIEPETGYVYIK